VVGWEPAAAQAADYGPVVLVVEPVEPDTFVVAELVVIELVDSIVCTYNNTIDHIVGPNLADSCILDKCSC
jgi:hypothetical protein